MNDFNDYNDGSDTSVEGQEIKVNNIFVMSLEDVINLVTYLQNSYIDYDSPAYYIMKDMQSFIERMKDNA